MDGPAGDARDESIGDLFGRLIDDGKSYAKAEVDLYRQIALHRAGRARTGLIALIAGAVLLLSSLTALILGLVLGLAELIGPLFAGLAIAALLALAGAFLVRFGITGLKALAGEEGERQALLRGESRP
ncbi:MAG TPA: phage holin family protein [Allosphingosinicella sp.]|nr:phage holin family protein [Allosphingosinicella sp.]